MKVKKIVRALAVLLIAVWVGCSTAGPKKTEPLTTGPSIQPPKLDLPADITMYRALAVIEHYGRQSQQHILYREYQQRTGGKGGDVSSWSPDWFYDSYVLDLNEQGYWATVTYSTARDARDRDERIDRLMQGVPVDVIDMRLKFPSGDTYLLGDSEADGVLDFARKAGQKPDTAPNSQDLERLKWLQEKYAWILGVIKRNYRKINK
jgi:hypothetical protein